MRRFLVLAMVLSALVASALSASAGLIINEYAAQVAGWSQTDQTLTEVRVDVTCPLGETFAGRVSVRSAGQTYFTGRISGECQGTPVEVATQQIRSRQIPCFQEFTIGGQIRFPSSGNKVFIQKSTDMFCAG